MDNRGEIHYDPPEAMMKLMTKLTREETIVMENTERDQRRAKLNAMRTNSPYGKNYFKPRTETEQKSYMDKIKEKVIS